MTPRHQGRRTTQQQAYRRRQEIALLLRVGWPHEAIARWVGCRRPTVTYYARTRDLTAA